MLNDRRYQPTTTQGQTFGSRPGHESPRIIWVLSFWDQKSPSLGANPMVSAQISQGNIQQAYLTTTTRTATTTTTTFHWPWLSTSAHWVPVQGQTGSDPHALPRHITSAGLSGSNCGTNQSNPCRAMKRAELCLHNLSLC